VSFAAAHADGRPHRALPQKPKLKSLNLGAKFFSLLIAQSPDDKNVSGNRIDSKMGME
jgi:hypothetical protein